MLPSVSMITSASVFGPSSGLAQAHSTNTSPFGVSSFGTSTSESFQPVQQPSFGSVAVPAFGFGVSAAPPSQSLFGQAAAASAVQPSLFSFAPTNPFAFGAQQPAASTTAVFGLGKRTNVADGTSGDGSKRQATGLCTHTHYHSMAFLDFVRD